MTARPRCAWCGAETGAGELLAWDGSGFWSEREVAVCSPAHRAAVERVMAFSRRHYRFYLLLVWSGILVYLLGFFAARPFLPHLTALVALDIGLCFFLFPFPPPMLARRAGLRTGIFLLRVLALVIIGAGFFSFVRAQLLS